MTFLLLLFNLSFVPSGDAQIRGFLCAGPGGFHLEGKVSTERAGRFFGNARLHWGLTRKQFSFRLDPEFRGGPWLMLTEGQQRFDSGLHFFGSSPLGSGASLQGVFGKVIGSPLEPQWNRVRGVQPLAVVRCDFVSEQKRTREAP